MKTLTCLTAAVFLAVSAMAQDATTDADDAKVLDEVETTETLRTSGRDRNRGAGEELAANIDREWSEQITCKTFKVTGSRIAKERVCRTNAQWRAQQEENQRSMRNVTMGQSGTPG